MWKYHADSREKKEKDFLYRTWILAQGGWNLEILQEKVQNERSCDAVKWNDEFGILEIWEFDLSQVAFIFYSLTVEFFYSLTVENNCRIKKWK